MRLTVHFDDEEWRCRDGTPVPEKWRGRVQYTADQLEVLRYELSLEAGREVPIAIVSGYRTEEYNRKVGGAPKSQHVQCRAADIHAKGVPARKVHATILRLIREGRMHNGGVGLYARSGFVHYDTRPKPARWKGN